MATHWWFYPAIRAAIGFPILLFRGRLIRTGRCLVPWPLTKPRRARWLCCSTLVFYPCRRAKKKKNIILNFTVYRNSLFWYSVTSGRLYRDEQLHQGLLLVFSDEVHFWICSIEQEDREIWKLIPSYYRQSKRGSRADSFWCAHETSFNG